MSHGTYSRLLKDTGKSLRRTLEFDQSIQGTNKPIKNELQAHNLVISLHNQYIVILNRLGDCCDQICQPQKRPVIRTLLELCIGRLLELKNELVNLDTSDMSYNDFALQEIKLTPFNLEINVVKYLKGDRDEYINSLFDYAIKINKGREKLDADLEETESSMRADGPGEQTKSARDVSKDSGVFAQENTGSAEAHGNEMSTLVAVELIQIHERARQGRYRAVRQSKLTQLKEIEKMSKDIGGKYQEAAVKIQALWRGHSVRRKLERRKTEQYLAVGLYYPSYIPTEQREKSLAIREYRHTVQKDYQREFEENEQKEKLRYLKVWGPWVMDDMKDEIREWFVEWYHKTGVFPQYPTEEQGGSLALIEGRVITPQHYLEQQIELERIKRLPKETRDKIKADKKLEKIKLKEKLKQEKAKEKSKKKEITDGFIMGTSSILPTLSNVYQEYENVWGNKDESDNPLQKYYLDMVKAKEEREAKLELRKIVDEMMRLELQMLNEALERDRANKKGKKGGKGKKKGKGKKGKKGAKGKKRKDLTEGKTVEELFELLFTSGIIRRCPQTSMSSFLGEFSYSAFEYRRMKQNPLHNLGDLRNVIMQYAVLPLGSRLIHQIAPLIKSLCLMGPEGVGKKLLVNAICCEVGAILFDLTPSNIANKYQGKQGLQMLMHLVEKVSKLLQPSIVFIDGAEKLFYKKIPKQEKATDPRRLKVHLPKFVKSITKEDMVLLLGITEQPWAAKPRPIVKLYNKFIFVPPPDYASAFLLWQNLLMKYPGVKRDFNVSALVKVAAGYSIGLY
uniref:ATPase AAA-type core domain-containing protein n=1 Tax=Timema genevievae TaxID=629358 RepID=A0A7R9PL85_TIMGE|nr:unnamed protein product [Timema genevievae]